MNLTLNPFAQVIKADDTYNFILADQLNPARIKPNDVQLQAFDNMYHGEFYMYDELCRMFDTSFIDELMRTGCLVPITIDTSIDTSSLYSRTNAFFLTHNMPNARENLSDKKILILGCGGIGTHMAWHMATLGVKKITLVDFDTVEVSNLNRQLLFDLNDVGKTKTDVLKCKLEAINKNVDIDTMQVKISSEKELEEICLRDNYSLIIKSLDSPAEFPVWLDDIAQKHSLTYITGITMRENVLIGPTYIPGQSKYGFSDLMDIKGNSAEKIFGTAPSLGVMLYHISDELAIEAFKILTGYGKSKYVNRILCKNIVTDEEQFLQKEIQKNENVNTYKNNDTWKSFVMNIALMISLSVAIIEVKWFIPVAIIAAMANPLYIYITRQNVVRCTFVNATIISIGLIFRYIGIIDLSTPGALVASLVIIFGVHSAFTLFTCIINYFMYKIFRREQRK